MNRPWPQITRESTRFSDTDFFALDITTLVCCVAIPKVSAKATSMDIGSGIGRPFKEETCRQDCGCDMLDVLRGHTTGEETCQFTSGSDISRLAKGGCDVAFIFADVR